MSIARNRFAAWPLLVLATLALAISPASAWEDGEPTSGVDLYLNNCANCHGDYGEGNGAVTPSLNVVLQDLRYLSARNDGEFPDAFVRQIIDGRETRASHGPKDMPVWGAEFMARSGYDGGNFAEAEARVAERIDALVAFLRQIQIREADSG